MDSASVKTVKFILSIISVIGAMLNGIGVGLQNIHIMLSGQIVWVISNSGWMIKKIKEREYDEFIMFLSFFISALYAVIMLLK